MGIINWVKGMLCTNKAGHSPVLRYEGMTVNGYECRYCHYQWYEKKQEGETR